MEIFIEGEVLASDTPRTWKLTCAGGRTGITEVVSFDDLTVVPMVVKPNGCITIPDPDMVEEVQSIVRDKLGGDACWEAVWDTASGNLKYRQIFTN